MSSLRMHTPVPTLALLAGLIASACSCAEDAPAVDAGAALDLLARRPDSIVEQPAEIVPQGDLPGLATFGKSEGPGWGKTQHRLANGAVYRETNQSRAEIVLPATRPVEREISLWLWCARPAGEAPTRVHVELNGTELAKDGLALGREPAEVRVHAPKEAWLRGTNHLVLHVDPVPRDGGVTWDTLALARVSYGPEARVTLDLEKRTARFVDGTGARYGLELASAGLLDLAGEATGQGVLSVRQGDMNPATGEVEMEGGDPASFTADAAGPLRGQLRLSRHPGAVRLIELEWFAPSGSQLTLERLAAREDRPVPRPPIVFVSIDTFAAQHLALYGYARATSPELQRFRQDAVLFERCLANAPWTLPSYLSVMSGLYPRSHGVALQFQAGADIQPQDLWQLADNRWTLAEALRARGYRTGGFVDTQWLAPVFRVDQGFDVYNGDGALAQFDDPHAHIEHIVERLVPPWLAGNDDGHPSFLFLHALDAHGPYLPDAPFRDSFTRDLPAARTSVPAGSDNQTYRWMPWWMSRTLQPDESVPEAPSAPLEEVVARYDESLLKVDAYLGKLFAHLRELGLYDRSVIVVTGDHGEFFGPGAYGHGVMHESVLHVPLLLKLPGNEHGGQRIERPVALVDVYPTLLELAGAAPDPGRLHGESLLTTLDGSAPERERTVLSEGGHVEQYALTQGCWRLVEEFPGSESSEASLLSHPRVSDDWLRANCPELLTQPLTKTLLKEILARPGFDQRLQELRKLVAGPYYALFDLCHDPEERRDLSGQESEVLARMKRALEAEKERSRAAQREAEVSGIREALSPEARAQLDTLGYGGVGSEGK